MDKKDIISEALPRRGLTNEEYRKAAIAMVNYIIQHNDEIRRMPPRPDVSPGLLRCLVSREAPEESENWQNVYKDLDEVITKKVLNLHSPNMFGLYPTANSYPAMLGDMLSTAVACVGFSWASSPACTELEMVMMDWLAKALHLPNFYLHESGNGGGVIQGSASEATLTSLLAARSRAVRKQLAINSELTPCNVVNRLIVYTSSCSHSSVQKASCVSLVKLRTLPTDESGAVRGNTLLEAIKEDKERGKIPMFFCATLGTTSCCAYDNLSEIGPVCKDENIWLHVDAAYAGVGLLCPELHYIAKGIEYTDSFSFDPHKLMMVNFDCSAFWVKNGVELSNSFNHNPYYLRHDNQDKAIDYMNWHVPMGRRFRSIKLWFVMRMVGLTGLRTHVRRSIAEAKYFEGLVAKDHRFEVLFPVTMGLVCFRLFNKELNKEGMNDLNKRLFKEVMAKKSVYVTQSFVNGVYFLRVATGNINTTRESLIGCWKVIQGSAERVHISKQQ